MKGLILSGGKGTRLRPITHTSAKQLIPVANKPILFYAIESIRDAGINDIGIIVGETAEEVKGAVGDGSKWGVKITYIKQDEPLGLAHAVRTAGNYLKDDEFVMFLGDNLIKDGITQLVDTFRKNKPNSQILLAKVKNPQMFGVAEIDGDRIIRLVEKPKEYISDLALVGVYMFDRNVHDVIETLKPSWRGEYEITDAIQGMVDRKLNVVPHIIVGWWKDTGKLEDLLEANRIILDTMDQEIRGKVDSKSQIIGKVIIEEDAEIVNSMIRGPAIIGKSTIVRNAYVGPFTAIHYGVEISSSEIEHSIVLENSKIIGVEGRIVDSLIGKNVEITKTDLKPTAYRLMLGDYSNIKL